MMLENLVVWQTISGKKFENYVLWRAGGTYYGGSNDYDFEARFSRLPRYKDESVFYQAWLYNDQKDDYISLGTSIGQPTLKRTDSRINFSTKQDLTNYNFLVLSLESVEDSDMPTQRILEWEIALRILENEVRPWSEKVEAKEKVTKEITATFVSQVKTPEQKRIESVLANISRTKLLILKARIDRFKDNVDEDSIAPKTLELLDLIEDAVEDLLNK